MRKLNFSRAATNIFLVMLYHKHTHINPYWALFTFYTQKHQNHNFKMWKSFKFLDKKISNNL